MTTLGVAGGLVATASCAAFSSDNNRATAPEDGGPGEAASPKQVLFGSARVIARHAPGLRGLAADPAHLYFANELTGEVSVAPKAGEPDGGSTVLALAKGATDIAVDTARVYWIDLPADGDLAKSTAFRWINKDNNQPGVGRSYARSFRMTLGAGQVFTVSRSTSEEAVILRNSEVEVYFGVSASPPRSVASDGVTVYYELNGAVHTEPKPDGGPAFASAKAIDLAVDDGFVYWITDAGRVQKLAKASVGDRPSDLAKDVSGLARIALDEESVYVTAWGLGPATGRVLRIPKAGGAPVELATGLAEPWGIAVDAQGVYVANHGDGTVIALPRL